MKRTFLIVSIAVIIASATSCSDKKKEAQLQGSIDSLMAQIQNRDLLVTDYFALVSDIESNINEIKQREKMISIEAEKNQTDDNSSKKQIVEDLKAINVLLEQNRTNMEELNKKLQGSYYQTGKFKKMAEELEARVTTQATEIESLNVKVTDLVARNETLSTRVDSLFIINTDNTEVIAQNEAAIQMMDEQLHTAYYTLGSSAELISKQIINKEGGFIGIGKVEQLNPQVNKNDFTLVDIRTISQIPLNSKKVELVTKHPADSYEIVLNEEAKQVDKLVILDPDKFWESSKLLVMVTK